MNEEGGKGFKVESTLCGAECESVVHVQYHVLWECPAYDSWIDLSGKASGVIRR